MPSKCPESFRARAVRLVLDRLAGDDAQSRYLVCKEIAAKLNVAPVTLDRWVEQARIDAGLTRAKASEELAEIRQLKRENAKLRRANEILKTASAFCSGSRPPLNEMIAYIDMYRNQFGGEPICRVLAATKGGFYYLAGLPGREGPACVEARTPGPDTDR